MPNPYGRSMAPMNEPTKDFLRARIAKLESALCRSEVRRQCAEEALKAIEDILHPQPRDGVVHDCGEIVHSALLAMETDRVS